MCAVFNRDDNYATHEEGRDGLFIVRTHGRRPVIIKGQTEHQAMAIKRALNLAYDEGMNDVRTAIRGALGLADDKSRN